MPEITPDQYAEFLAWFQANAANQAPQQTSTQTPQSGQSATALIEAMRSAGSSGTGDMTTLQGNTKDLTLSNGQHVIVDMNDGHVISTLGSAEPSKFAQESQLQQERFAHEDAQSAQKYQQARELRDTDPQNDPWRSMMPRYSPPSAVQGPRGALDIIDPNTGQLINVRQPEAPDVRVAGGNLIVPPGANAAVYYNGNKGQATNVSGGPPMVYGNAQFPSAMSQAERVAGRLQSRGANGGSGGGAGAMAGNRFGAPGGSGGRGAGMSQFRNLSPYQTPLVANRFAAPPPALEAGPTGYTGQMYGPEGITPESFLGPRQLDLNGYDTSEPIDPFNPDMNYDFGYYS